MYIWNTVDSVLVLKYTHLLGHGLSENINVTMPNFQCKKGIFFKIISYIYHIEVMSVLTWKKITYYLIGSNHWNGEW